MAKAKKSKKIRRRPGRDALDFQEAHSPTVEIAVDDPEATRKTRRNMTRVRQSEAWRHNRLTGMQRDAEKEMEFAWRQRTAGLGAAASRYGESRGALNRADLGASINASWREWCSEADRRRIDKGVVIEVLSEPKTLTEVERSRRMGRGQALAEYIRGMDLWCELRGWTRGRANIGPHLSPEGITRA